MSQPPNDNVLTLNATAEFQAAEGDGPARVKIRAYDGNEMTVSPHGPLVVESSLLQIPESVPLLSDHNEKRDGVVGAGAATVHPDGLIEIEGTLSKATAAGREILGLAADGVRWQASIGVRMNSRANRRIHPRQTLQANGKQFTAGPRGLKHVRGGVLREVSILIAGADNDTTVDIAATEGEDATAAHEDVLQEITRLQAGGLSIRRIAGKVDRSPSTLGAVITGEIADPPAALLSDLQAITV